MLKENLKGAFAASKLYVKEVAAASGVKKATIDNWLSAKSKEPRAVDLYAVCKAVGITVEQALEGEAGVQYVRQWVRQAGGVWNPPERIADIVENLLFLDESQLGGIRANAAALAAPKKGSERHETQIAG